MLMNVFSTLAAVITTVSTPLDLTDVVVELDTDWLPMDAPVQVAIFILADMYVSDSISSIGASKYIDRDVDYVALYWRPLITCTFITMQLLGIIMR